MTIILPVLYKYETWSLTLRPKHRLSVYSRKGCSGRHLGWERINWTVEKTAQWGSSSFVPYTNYWSNYGDGHNTWCAGEEKCRHSFGGETWRKEAIWKIQA